GVPQHQKNLIFVRQGDKVKVEYTRSPVRVGRGRRGEAKKVEIPKGINGRPVDQANYREVQNAGQFKHGDILPGSAFVLGDARTYNRELLSVNTGKSSSLYKLRQAARRLAQSHQGTKKELVDKIADLVEQAYPSQKDNHKAAEAMTIGHFIVNGGCCRHRSAALQMALQSANSGLRQAGSLMRINSQYTRGRLGGAGNHAWVEVKLSRGNYVVDPNANNPKTGKKNRGFMEDSLQLKSKEGEIMFGAGYHLYIRGGYGTTVWRPKSLVK
ncbi:MAG: hypothetical protein HQ564_04415, partial [Candidatus Saganbacteria bacterium]|nr:hypothetical protein [Candidatus Saganbacteria bacterium]